MWQWIRSETTSVFVVVTVLGVLLQCCSRSRGMADERSTDRSGSVLEENRALEPPKNHGEVASTGDRADVLRTASKVDAAPRVLSGGCERRDCDIVMVQVESLLERARGLALRLLRVVPGSSEARSLCRERALLMQEFSHLGLEEAVDDLDRDPLPDAGPRRTLARAVGTPIESRGTCFADWLCACAAGDVAGGRGPANE